MCIRDRDLGHAPGGGRLSGQAGVHDDVVGEGSGCTGRMSPVSYTHLRAHETVLDIVCRLLLEKKKKDEPKTQAHTNDDDAHNYDSLYNVY